MSNEFLPPNQEEVNSDSLTEYLFTFSPVAPESCFAPHLNLSHIRPFVDELYEHYTPESTFSEADPQVARDALQEAGIDDSSIMDSLQNDTTNVERARTVYFDPVAQIIDATSITTDTEDSVMSDVVQTAQSGLIPLIDIHTHPTTSLFSPEDFTALLSGKDNLRLVKASLVLCPDMQILALATEDTPALTQNEMQEFLTYWNNALAIDEDEKFIQSLTAKYANFLDQKQRLKEQSETNGPSEEAFIGNRDDIDHSETVALYQKLRHDVLIEVRRAESRIFIQLAHAAGVKLYTSTDRENFYEASA